MKINYRIIWVDDEPDDMEAKKDLLYEIIEKHHMFPEGMESPYKSFNQFKNEMIDRYTPNKFVDCDLLLIDYNLSDNGDKTQTGEEIIKQLRDKGVYTDVLFYSGNMSSYRKSKKYSDLDNVVYSDSNTDEFQMKFEKILEKQENLSMGIQNLRGYLMDATSDFDFVTRNYVESLYSTLNGEERILINQKIQSFIKKQKLLEDEKFDKIFKKFNKDSLITPAMSSIDYVMSVKDKIYILGMMLYFKKIIKADIDDVEIFAANFANNYDLKIIKNRNKLAHNKLKYGENKNHVKILRSINDIECKCDECNLEYVYTLEQFKNIKDNIFDTYALFENLLKNLINRDIKKQ